MQLLQLTAGICLTLLSILPEGDAQYRWMRRRRWKFEATARGYIYASRSFRVRYTATMNPKICFNMINKPPELNDTFPNGSRIYSTSRKTYQNFICPLDDPKKIYCCGHESQQFCCSFWSDYGRSVGASFGLFIAAMLVLWFLQGFLKALGQKFPKLKRCVGLCPGRPNNVRQVPSTVEIASPSCSSSSPAAEAANPDAEPKPLAVAPLAPPSYSSLSIREVDIFGDPLTTNLPPPPNYDAVVHGSPEGSGGVLP